MRGQSELEQAMETFRVTSILSQLTEAQWEFIEGIVAGAYMTEMELRDLDEWLNGKRSWSIKQVMAWLNTLDVRNKLLERDMEETVYESHR